MVTKKVSKKVVKKPVKKTNKKVQVVSQSIKSTKKNPKPVLTTTAKVDTSTPVNKWIGSDFNSALDDMDLEPYQFEYCESTHKVNPLEHKMFEVSNIEEPKLKFPFWLRVLYWFVK